MDNDISRPCRWSQSLSECSKDINNSQKLTSAFWKQLIEENDLSTIHIPSSTQSASPTIEKSLPAEKDVASKSLLPQSKSTDFWQLEQSPSKTLNLDKKQLKDPWVPLINPSQISCDMRNSLNSSLAGNAFRQSSPNVDKIPAIGDEENVCPTFTRFVGTCKNESGLVSAGPMDSKNSKSDLFPSYQSLTDSLWDTNTNISCGNSFPLAPGGADSYGLSNSSSWDHLLSSLSQRQVLQDIGNTNQPSVIAPPKVCHPHPFQTPTDLTAPHEPSLPYSISAHESFSGQGTPSFHPQRQHTDLVALMQELSVVSAARDAGHLPYSGNMLQTYPHQKTSTITPGSVKGCVFCKNNNYHSTFYKSHILKDERGHCQCPVLRMYVCPLCSATGDAAHTLKYCPRNTVTHGDPISAGLPPGKVTSWREVANRMMGRYNANY
ncbi:uncharacterized protein [Panulirus ornatus]|uniref:uncharacterized protein isoform X2 n=1 Tax=Panulirus ornatus TaxID=150431 RepID=UPI003A8A714C